MLICILYEDFVKKKKIASYKIMFHEYVNNKENFS